MVLFNSSNNRKICSCLNKFIVKKTNSGLLHGELLPATMQRPILQGVQDLKPVCQQIGTQKFGLVEVSLVLYC